MNGCDTDTTLTQSSASCLVSAHHSAVGRYLRNLTVTEINNIHNAGLKIWSIYEEGYPTSVSYFTYAQGQSDASTAISQAQSLKIPEGTPIFFAVDYAPASSDQSAILDYFNGVSSKMAAEGSPYLIGVYGSYTVMWWLWNDANFNNTIYYWQTEGNGSCGWLFPFNDLYQISNTCNDNAVTSCDVTIDPDYILNAAVLW